MDVSKNLPEVTNEHLGGSDAGDDVVKVDLNSISMDELWELLSKHPVRVGILDDPYHKLVPLPRIPDSREQYCKSRGSSYDIAAKPLRTSALAKARLQRWTDVLHKMTCTLSQQRTQQLSD